MVVASRRAAVVIFGARDSAVLASRWSAPPPRSLDVVAEPLLTLGWAEDAARDRAAELLARLNIPERLWRLSPTTF